ncbi:ionotropic receptor 21a [Bacillus rossius redtenbacheri]|uniref:ionotropic receptor 21a n=1 Tax=Bacillus rossius redtenbacheri TaxID=93214 RepID=UPI002FDD99F5
MSPFHSHDVASFPDDPLEIFEAPKTRRRQGLANILRVDHYSPYAEVPEKAEELTLFVGFVSYVAERYLHGCASVVLYDDHYETTRELLLRSLLSRYPLPRTHGKASTARASRAQPGGGACRHYVLLLRDLALAQAVGNQSVGRVVVVTEASPTEVQRFLAAGPSHGVVNLLVVTAGDRRNKEPVLVLHTHEPFAGDGRAGRLLTSWRRCGLTRDVDLFPDKFRHGLGGRRLVAAVSEQPHYVILRSSQASGVVRELVAHRAHVGLAGLYVSPYSLGQMTLSVGHSIDCASFITRTSTALPRYRAIMGPFHWSVWLALTLTYLLAIFPVAFSHQHSLSDLLKNPWQMENMFWYVFGTFTNCFTFTGKQSWTSTDKNATRMFIAKSGLVLLHVMHSCLVMLFLFCRDTSKRAFLHIAEECFVPFHVALGFPRGTPHSDAMNRVLLRALQSGLVLKLRTEVDWELQRSSTGHYLQAGF